MSAMTLGLDIGTNSIGWALVDEENEKLVNTGVRIFPEGVDRDQQGGEKSKNQGRREARSRRRQLARRRRRLANIRRHMSEVGLLPTEKTELDQLLEKDPYDLRKRALDEKLHPFEIGRAFYHLAQRRGFLSNRKTDKEKKKEASEMLKEISELAQSMDESGSRTLGEHLASILVGSSGDRVRGMHTRRQMLVTEFEAIWEAQRPHHPDLLTDVLKYGSRGPTAYPTEPSSPASGKGILSEYGVHGLIFFQRKMYWPKTSIGMCELEPRRRRCERADRAAQRFRMLQEVNNLRYFSPATGEENELDQSQRTVLLDYLSGTKHRTFDQIRKKLKMEPGVRFNLEQGGRSKLQGHETDAAMGAKKAFGKRWAGFDEELKDTIVQIVLNSSLTDEEAERRLVEQCGLDPKDASIALDVHLPQGHMNFSREAILNLLPHLEEGKLVMGEDASNSAMHAAGYLRPDQRQVKERDFLPPSPDLPNPIVAQALVEVRKLVNAIIREYGKPANIHVELARDAKLSFARRQEIRIENASRRKAREAAREEIEKTGAKATRKTIDRYMLWKEQQETCIYCNHKISLRQLLSGEADFDHILPRWRSLDDSLANKVISHRKCNKEKGDKTPREWLEEANPERYKTVLDLAKKHLPYNKLLKFKQKDITLDYFINRQLTDTAYISRSVKSYLQCLGARVVSTRGQMTADLRHNWGLQTILDQEGKGEKNRSDHRHHAIDAITVALTKPKHLQSFARARGKDVPVPWEGFRAEVEQAVKHINVSHRPRTGLSGALHEETFYGSTQKVSTVNQKKKENRPWAKGWVENPDIYVRRKPVYEIKKTKHLDKVRDSAIRKILESHLEANGIDPKSSGNIPSNVFCENNLPCMPSGMPIKRVRMVERGTTFRRVSTRRSYQYVKTGSNYCIVYRSKGNDASEKWKAEVMTTWDASVRAKNSGKPIVDKSDNDKGRFIMSLSIGETFQIDGKDGEPLLCVVRKLDQRSRRLHYKSHLDARISNEIEKDNLYLSPAGMQEHNARKVTIDLLGRIRRAGD